MQYIPAVIVFMCQEVIALIIFPILNAKLGPKKGRAWDTNSILKGVMERLVLYTALIHGYPHMLIAFSAIKLGTRLTPEQEEEKKISNTYFLVGNLISIFMVIVSTVVIKGIWNN